jgi:creatinine amidohydrolase
LIHHGFNRLIFVNGHGSNVKVVDPVLRRLRYETGALIGYYKPYAERYIGMLKDVLEGPVEETPGWHAGELETSQVLAHNPDLVRLDRAKPDKAHAPAWLGEAWAKKDGMPDAEFEGYQYFNFPFDHEEFTDSGVMGVPQRGTSEKGEIAFSRFATHLIHAVEELEKVEVNVKNRDWTEGKAWLP